jgi:hypothetical protein
LKNSENDLFTFTLGGQKMVLSLARDLLLKNTYEAKKFGAVRGMTLHEINISHLCSRNRNESVASPPNRSATTPLNSSFNFLLLPLTEILVTNPNG